MSSEAKIWHSDFEGCEPTLGTKLLCRLGSPASQGGSEGTHSGGRHHGLTSSSR